MENCIFCKIIIGEIPSYKIYEDQYVFACLDISNDANGHILVLPKKHCRNVLDAEGSVLAQVMKAIKIISNHLVEKCGFEGINILNNNGVCAEQSVLHLHFHILPRKTGDGLKIFPSLEKNVETIEEIHKKLKIN